jgi:hypothetical protein
MRIYPELFPPGTIPKPIDPEADGVAHRANQQAGIWSNELVLSGTILGAVHLAAQQNGRNGDRPPAGKTYILSGCTSPDNDGH